MTVWLFIPARDEAPNIAGVIVSAGAVLEDAGYEVRFIVVDDGSRDATVARAVETKYAAATEIMMPAAAGIGGTFSAGITAVMRAAAVDDVLLLLEGDGTSDPRLLPAMLRSMQPDSGVVIASRFRSGGGYKNFPWLRRLQSQAVNRLFVRWVSLPQVEDYTIFYRGYRLSALRAAWPDGECRLISAGFAANTELLMRVVWAGARATEVPFLYDYAGKQSYSKLPALATIIGHLRLLLYVPVIRRGYLSQK